MKKLSILLPAFALLFITSTTGCTVHHHTNTAVAPRANTQVVVVKKRPNRRNRVHRKVRTRRGVVVVRR